MIEENGALVQAEAAVIAAQRDYDDARREQTEARAAYQQVLERQVQARLQAEDAQRMLEHSARVRQTLTHFRREVVAHHVHRIEKLVLEALRALLHKNDLVSGVAIDPDNFAITLRGEGWEASGEAAAWLHRGPLSPSPLQRR